MSSFSALCKGGSHGPKSLLWCQDFICSDSSCVNFISKGFRPLIVSTERMKKTGKRKQQCCEVVWCIHVLQTICTHAGRQHGRRDFTADVSCGQQRKLKKELGVSINRMGAGGCLSLQESRMCCCRFTHSTGDVCLGDMWQISQNQQSWKLKTASKKC